MDKCISSTDHCCNSKHIKTSFPVVRFGCVSNRNEKTTLTLNDFFEAIQNDSDEKKACREAAKNNDKSGVNAAKQATPAWALCNDTGTNDGIPNGLVQIDLDHVGEYAETIKFELAKFPQILAAFLSVSGQGVCALMYAPDREKGSRTAEIIAEYLRRRGYSFCYDKSCFKPCQLRIESFDPCPYIADRVTDCAFYGHQISRLARMFNTDATTGSIATGAALAFSSMFSYAFSDYGAGEYYANGQAALIAESADGKTGILDVLTMLSCEFEHLLASNGTAAGLRDVLIKAGTEEVQTTNTEGKIETIRSPRKKAEDTTPTDFIVDEAGDSNLVSKQDPQKVGRFKMFRETFSGHITTESLKGTAAMYLPCRLTVVFGSTLKQFAASTAADDKTSGGARRLLEFYQKHEKLTDSRAMRDRAEKRKIDDATIERLRNIAGNLKKAGKRVFKLLKEDEDCIFSAIDAYIKPLTEAGIDFDRDGLTLVFNTAALCASIRAAFEDENGAVFDAARRHKFTFTDILVTCEILLEVANARRIIAEAEAEFTDSKFKSAAQIVREILDALKSGAKQVSSFMRKGRDWKTALDYLKDQHMVMTWTEYGTSKNGKQTKRAMVRLVDEDETDAFIASSLDNAALEGEFKARKSAERQKGLPYDQCDEGEKTNRVRNYIEKFTKDHPLIEGQRDNNLRSLAGKMRKAGLKDEVAETIFNRTVLSCGLVEKDAKRLWEQRGLEN